MKKLLLLFSLLSLSVSIQAQTLLPAIRIQQDATHQFATDAEKAGWNALPGQIAALQTTTSSLNSSTNALISGLANLSIIVANNGTAITSHTTNTANPHNVNKAQVGLGNVDNTSDINKPISTATQSALDGKAALAHTQAFSTLTGTASPAQLGTGSPASGKYLDGSGSWVTLPVSGTSSSSTISSRFVPLFIFNGESNSGGMAVNANATSTELSVRPAVQILNNTSLAFQSLQIGVNNLIDHAGLTANATHGWELELANLATANAFWDNPVYLVKTGQGASTLAQWNLGGTYWTKFATRVDSARVQLRRLGKVPVPYVFLSLGLNDYVAGTTASAFKAGLKAHIANLRSKLGYVPVIMPRFMTGFDTYSAMLDEIATEDPFVSVVSSTSATLLNSTHWDYAGMKLLTDRMVDVVLNKVGQHQEYQLSQTGALSTLFSSQTSTSSSGCAGATTTVASWTSMVSSVTATGSQAGAYLSLSGSLPSGGRATQTVSASSCFEIVVDYDNATVATSALVYLDPVSSDTYTYSGKNFLTSFFLLNSAAYYQEGTSYTLISNSAIQSYPAKLKIKHTTTSPNDIAYYISTDGGTNYSLLRYSTNVLAGQTTLYVKALFADGSGSRKLKVSITQ